MVRLTREKKAELVDKLAKYFSKSPSVVFAHFNKLNIHDEQKMRNALRDEGARYMVARKTLIKRALEKASPEGQAPELEGEIAFAFLEQGDDISLPARKIHEFSQEFDGAVEIVGGIFEGKFKNAFEMQEIASIPTEPVLRGMFVNVINSPIQGFVSVLSQIAEKK